MRVSRADLMKWGTLLFLFVLPWGTKKFLFDFASPFRNYYTSEYTSAFLYGSDILLILLIGLFLVFGRGLFAQFRGWLRRRAGLVAALALFLALSLASVLFADYPLFSVYSFVRLTLCALAMLLVATALESGLVRFKEAAVAVSVSAVFEAVVGFLQFALQKSVGLWFLGETVFVPGTPGIATVAVDGAKFVRAYGTMPHANILAGFLVLGFLALLYLLLREERPIWRCLETAGVFIVLTGLFLTFSRSGWITGAAAVFSLFVWEFFRNKDRKHLYRAALVAIVSIVALLGSLQWVISPRAHLSATEGPVADRWNYDRIGMELMLSNPLGVGIGNELFYVYHTGLFAKYGLNSLGQWQPTHNLYLMVGTETGFLGLTAFLVFIVLLLWTGRRSILDSNPEVRVSVVIFLALLILGLFDHFLWDLELGRLMFWVVIGILLGTSPRSSSSAPTERSSGGGIGH